MKTFSAYEEAALSTAVYPGQGTALGLIYTALKAAGEAGEFAGHYLSGGIDVVALSKEVGDELWYVAAKARELGTTLAELLGTDDIAEFEATYHRVSTIPVGSLALMGTHYAGCFAEHLGKAIRDDGFGQPIVWTEDPGVVGVDYAQLTPDRARHLVNYVIAHAGNLAEKAQALDTSLVEIAAGNIAKLLDRKARGVLGGSGDNR